MDLNSLPGRVGLSVVLLAAAFAAGRYTVPTKIVTKTETQIVEKEVIKNKEVNSRDTNRNRELVTTEVIAPDGTITRTKHYINRDEVREESTRTNTTTTNTSTETRSSTVTTTENANWNVSALATMSHTKDDVLSGSISYGVHVQRRVLGPFSVGAFGLTNQTYGLSLGGSF